ncbi:Carnitinyl-CoA dehydratase [Variovorax boronicumulans]|uniref:enoyl-CoA hydratase-related protein n=1 Tax=Variovorax boronicumulans TaxID=436515 RepID=UPI00209C0237|nr:enoyl-CoA hydratase-related protein [Variovorax boronicumulans]PBI87780.1 Carnitinyl-CoA dehydratase [Variovorax boronicumulans]
MNLIIDTRLPNGVRRITLNRPEAKNAFDAQIMRAISLAFRDAAKDSETRVVVLSGAGSHFCAGGDIAWMKETLAASQAQKCERASAVADMLATVYALPQPLVAEVRGAAMGGGFGLVCCADFVVADSRAKFALSETRLGIVPAVISPYVVAALGVRRANRLALAGTSIDTLEAKEMGLVTHMAAPDDIAQVVSALLHELLCSASGAQQRTKALFRQMASPASDAHRATLAVEALVNAWEQQDAIAGFDAFLNKTTPPWRT